MKNLKSFSVAVCSATFAVSAWAGGKADLINCQLDVTRGLDASSTQTITLATIYSEADSRHEVDQNLYKGKMYALGYGQGGNGGLTQIHNLPNTTVGAQVTDSHHKRSAALLTLDLTDLVQSLKQGSAEVAMRKVSEKVTLGANETASITCTAVDSRAILLKTINTSLNDRNRQILNQILK